MIKFFRKFSFPINWRRWILAGWYVLIGFILYMTIATQNLYVLPVIACHRIVMVEYADKISKTNHILYYDAADRRSHRIAIIKRYASKLELCDQILENDILSTQQTTINELLKFAQREP